VGRPPQGLMRGWGRPPICKASKPNHTLGVQATHNLAERGKKGRCRGQRRTCKECRDERPSSGVQGENCEKSVF
jgi:hypothetical protein